ncbi:hypothetical protein SAMN06265218_102172 [Fodinibius sediminis]|uniref:Uncharacterized protein n=2 Tax=Fodinibius sediminis TaxID=1214077 RepID=A0A521B445_9BACT|nr:hypothetical protein SAMN06265218_102172 [Fodinibius sediminis]
MAFFYGLILLLVLALLIGYKTVYSSLAVAMLLFIGNAWAYSFGKINHDIFLILVPLVLALMYWRQGFSTGKKNQPYAWPIPVFALIIGGGNDDGRTG